MPHEITISGRKVEIDWNTQSAKRYAFRMGEIGGEPTGKQLSNPKTLTNALFKVLWGLLPPDEFKNHADPETLFVSVDHETESAAIFKAISEIYQERFPTEEKKSTLTKSPLPVSS